MGLFTVNTDAPGYSNDLYRAAMVVGAGDADLYLGANGGL